MGRSRRCRRSNVAFMLCASCLGTCVAFEYRHAGSGTTVAVALEGGGFRALSSDAGLFSGLVAASNSTALASSGLLDRFSIFSSVSGSSWFMSELLFSPRFLSLLDGMAASPSTAAAQFRAAWSDPWLKATKVTASKFNVWGKIARKVVQKLLGTADEDTIYLAQYFLTTGFAWEDFVNLLLNSTGSIGQEMTLGHPVGAWARQKVWLVDHNILLPTGRKEARLFQGKLSLPQASYAAIAKGPELPVFIPAQFSVTLGAGPNCSAPFPYVASTAVASLERLDFKGVVIPIVDQPSAASGTMGADVANGALTRNVGSLPITGVAAASSAFMGSTPVMGFLVDELQALVNGDMTPWVASAPGGQAFGVARRLVRRLRDFGGVNQKSVDELASAGVHGVIDGGFSDGTGLSQAVAAGASEVLVVLNSNATNDPLYVEALFKGGPSPAKPGVPADLFPVFESPVASVVRSQFKGFHVLQLPASSQFLKVLAVGTIQAVTAENRFFGIQGGRYVTIHVVNICSSLSIGQFENLLHYDALAQEVASTIIDDGNAAFVQSTLLPIFLGSSVASTTEGLVLV